MNCLEERILTLSLIIVVCHTVLWYSTQYVNKDGARGHWALHWGARASGQHYLLLNGLLCSHAFSNYFMPVVHILSVEWSTNFLRGVEWGYNWGNSRNLYKTGQTSFSASVLQVFSSTCACFSSLLEFVCLSLPKFAHSTAVAVFGVCWFLSLL